MSRSLSLAVLIAAWAVAAALVQSRLLPGPLAVGATTLAEIRSGELPFQMACTLGRVIAAFTIAMMLGWMQNQPGRMRLARVALSFCLVLMPIAAATVLVGCGGGSSSTTPPPPPPALD